MIADRGWTFDDRVTGLIEHSRLPDASAFSLGRTPPIYAHLFTEMDNRPGWYVDLSWEPTDIGGFEVMRYDNDADATVEAGRPDRLAHAFLGRRLRKADRQAHGPEPGHERFDLYPSLGVLQPDAPISAPPTRWRATTWTNGGRQRGSTSSRPAREATFPSSLDEDGHAYTLSLSYLPWKWLRFTGEFISIDDTRQERAAVGEDPHQIENQFQFLTRVYF